MILVAIGSRSLNAAVCGILGIFGKRVVPAYCVRDLLRCKDALQDVPHELIIEESLCGIDLCDMLESIKRDYPEVSVTLISENNYSYQSELALKKGLAWRRIVKPEVVRELEHNLTALV